MADAVVALVIRIDVESTQYGTSCHMASTPYFGWFGTAMLLIQCGGAEYVWCVFIAACAQCSFVVELVHQGTELHYHCCLFCL